MTNKERLEKYYKERGMLEFMRLILSLYEQLPEKDKNMDPATAILCDKKDSEIKSFLVNCLEIPTYEPKLLKCSHGSHIHEMLYLLSKTSTAAFDAITRLIPIISEEELLYYIVGAAIDTPVSDHFLPVMADIAYTAVHCLQENHKVQIATPSEFPHTNTLNLLGRLFCTGRDVEFEMIEGLQYMLQTTIIPKRMRDFNAFVFRHVYGVPGGLYPAGYVSLDGLRAATIIALCSSRQWIGVEDQINILYNVGLRLVRYDSNIKMLHSEDVPVTFEPDFHIMDKVFYSRG